MCPHISITEIVHSEPSTRNDIVVSRIGKGKIPNAVNLAVTYGGKKDYDLAGIIVQAQMDQRSTFLKSHHTVQAMRLVAVAGGHI